jgi:hypothetical protein
MRTTLNVVRKRASLEAVEGKRIAHTNPGRMEIR